MKKCVVYIEGGYTQLMLPSGEVLPHEVEGILKSPVAPDKDNPNAYTATFIVDIVSTKEEALKHLGIEA